MIYLLASIVASTSILVLFRWMQQSTAVTRHAIVVGYLASTIAGALLFDVDWHLASQQWFWPAAVEGVGFYIVFRMMALTTQQAGITIASIATKMSVVIPTLIGIVALGESISTIKIAGLVFGFLAVILATGFQFKVVSWYLPLMVFIATGLIDASFKLFQVWGLTEAMFPEFMVTVFGFAFITAFVHHLMQSDKLINPTSALFGTALGLANLGTVYFVMKALAQKGLESSVVFPLNNVGIVLASTLTAIIVFGERPALLTKLSLGAAVVSIGLLYAAT